jgi:hypothetical protein
VALATGEANSMHVKTLIAAFAATMAVSVSPAAATTLFAAPEGDGAFPCERADPCELPVAVDDANDVDRVKVLPGRYELAETLTIDTDATIRGDRRHPPRLVIGDDIAISVPIADPTVSDLVVRSDGAALSTGFSAATFQRLRLIGDSHLPVCHLPDAPGLMRDVICVNRDTGAALGKFVATGGTYAVDFILINVTAIARSHTSADAHALLAEYTTGATGTVDVTYDIANSILRGGGAAADIDVAAGGPGTETVALDLRRSNWATDDVSAGVTVTPAGSAGNQTVEPRFVRPAELDYRQRAASPTVDRGLVHPMLGAFDFEGDPRQFGPRPDIGADEYAGP